MNKMHRKKAGAPIINTGCYSKITAYPVRMVCDGEKGLGKISRIPELGRAIIPAGCKEILSVWVEILEFIRTISIDNEIVCFC